jgi:hypothetical protein
MPVMGNVCPCAKIKDNFNITPMENTEHRETDYTLIMIIILYMLAPFLETWIRHLVGVL